MAKKKTKGNTDDLPSLDPAYDRAPFDLPELDTYKTLCPLDLANIIDSWEFAVIEISQAIIEGDKEMCRNLAHKYSLAETGNLLRLAMEDRGISCDAIIRLCELFEQAASGFDVTLKAGWLEDVLAATERLKTKLALELVADAPPDLIPIAQAVQDYHVSRSTLCRAIADGRLTDHRPPDHKKNAGLRLSRADLDVHWQKKQA